MKKILSVIIFIVALTSCMVGPKFNNPGWEAESRYRNDFNIADTDSITSLKWWEVYQDTVLQSLIRTALAENQDMEIAASRILEAKFTLGYHRADMYPTLDYSAGVSIINKTNSEAAEDGTLLRDNANGFAVLNWELDFWGKYRHANKAAKAQLMASEEARQVLTTSLVAQVASSYFQLRSLDDQLMIALRTLEIRKESTRIITERFEGGYVAELDKFQAQSQEAVAAALVPSIERQIAQTEITLSILLGKNPGYIIRGLENVAQEFPLSIPEGLPSQLLARRPDVRQAEDMWISQNEQIGVAQAARYPSISLTGLFGAASSDLTNITETGSVVSYAMGTISGPLFYFQKNKRRVDIEREKTEQARLNYEKTVLKAFGEVENALISVRTYRMEYEARSIQAGASHGAAVLSRQRYDAGYTNYLEVLENDRSELDALLLASQALQYHLQSTVQLYKALGGGWEIQ